MVTTKIIKDKRRELEELEAEYVKKTPPCMNKGCLWWNPDKSGSCHWTILLEDCNGYNGSYK